MSEPKKDKTYTKEELSKAIDEAFALGFSLGKKENIAPPYDMPNLVNEIQMTSLAKNIGSNAKAINKNLIEKHRKASENHMKEWAKDASKALDEVLEAASQHKNHKH